MAVDTFECKIVTGGFTHCGYSWDKTRDELDQCFKIYLPVTGEAQIIFDEKLVSITPGNVYFLSGFNIQAQKCILPMDIYWLHFVPSSLYLRQLLMRSKNIFVWKGSDVDFTDDFRECIKVVFKDERDFRKSTLVTEYLFEEAKLHSILLEIIAKILKDIPGSFQEKSEELIKIEPSIKFMKDEFRNNPSLGDIAAKSLLAPNYFHRIFKRNFGLTPFKYMQSLRMEIAVRLLTSTSKTIKEIANETGYDNEYYFYRQFKNYSGYSPGKLRMIKPF